MIQQRDVIENPAIIVFVYLTSTDELLRFLNANRASDRLGRQKPDPDDDLLVHQSDIVHMQFSEHSVLGLLAHFCLHGSSRLFELPLGLDNSFIGLLPSSRVFLRQPNWKRVSMYLLTAAAETEKLVFRPHNVGRRHISNRTNLLGLSDWE
jgi:hypothetical protein